LRGLGRARKACRDFRREPMRARVGRDRALAPATEGAQCVLIRSLVGAFSSQRSPGRVVQAPKVTAAKTASLAPSPCSTAVARAYSAPTEPRSSCRPDLPEIPVSRALRETAAPRAPSPRTPTAPRPFAAPTAPA